MPRLLQLGESQSINKTSPSDWTNAIDGGLEVGPGTSIMLNRALIHKPGADLEESAGSLTVEHDIHTNIRAYVGTVAVNTKEHCSGLANPQTNFKRYYAVQTYQDGTEGFIESLNIPIHVPAGTYRPENLCALLSDQTRTPISFKDVPAGSIQSPSTLLLKDGGQSPTIEYCGSDIYDNQFIITDISLPPSKQVMDNFAQGNIITLKFTDPRTPGQQTLQATVLAAPNQYGQIATSVNFGHPSPIPIIYIYVQSSTHKYFLRKNETDTSDQMYPQGDVGVLSRELFGCTTGISFQYDETTGRVQMSAHSPLYHNDDVSLLMAIDTSTNGIAYSGTGARGFLAFGDGAWGYSRDNWMESPWALLGFAYDDLNGSTDRTDSSGWVYSDAYIDSAMDITQSNQAQGPEIWLQSERSNGPRGEVLSLAPGTIDVGMWLIQVSLLPHTEETRWIHSDGSSVSGVVGVCTKTYASGDYFSSEGGPVWTLSKKQAPFTLGSVRVRILNAQDCTPDETIGAGSMVLLEVS